MTDDRGSKAQNNFVEACMHLRLARWHDWGLGRLCGVRGLEQGFEPCSSADGVSPLVTVIVEGVVHFWSHAVCLNLKIEKSFFFKVLFPTFFPGLSRGLVWKRLWWSSPSQPLASAEFYPRVILKW